MLNQPEDLSRLAQDILYLARRRTARGTHKGKPLRVTDTDRLGSLQNLLERVLKPSRQEVERLERQCSKLEAKLHALGQVEPRGVGFSSANPWAYYPHVEVPLGTTQRVLIWNDDLNLNPKGTSIRFERLDHHGQWAEVPLQRNRCANLREAVKTVFNHAISGAITPIVDDALRESYEDSIEALENFARERNQGKTISDKGFEIELEIASAKARSELNHFLEKWA